jgi:hypothetical protein
MKRAKRYLTAEGDAAARQDGGDAGLRLREMTALERSDALALPPVIRERF